MREAFHAQLMLALYRAGRQADALTVYRDLRSASSRELGVEPGSAIRSLHSAILNSDPSLALTQAPALPPTPPAPAPHSPIPSPRQLPADTRLFTGRTAELDELTALALTGNPTSGTVVISAINGMGGVGKTALAVRAAHRLHERYPDGQLFIDLHGYSVDLDPVAPEDALDYLLRSLGVPPHSIPSDLDSRTALYRTRLAASRTLILLDNAVNAAQVGPLLPAAPGCLVLITSRNRLTSLDDAHLLALDVLPHTDAVALLRDVAGPTRAAELDAEPTAVAELITLCARTPLAIRIVAARLRHRSSLTVAALNAELREEVERLDHIQDGDRDLTSVFNASLRVLPEPAQRLFRLLGLIPGPDFDPYAAAHLTATDLRTAERHLDTLLDHNLLIQQTPARYRLHDLLRAHARTLAAQDPESPTAFTRLVDHYVATACAADSLTVKRLTWPFISQIPEAVEPVQAFTDRASAQTWIRIEHANLLALIVLPATSSSRRDALIEALTLFHRVEGPWSTGAHLQTVFIASAQRRKDRSAEARALNELSMVVRGLGNPGEALEYLNRALGIFEDLGDERGVASALTTIGSTHFQAGDFHLAVEPYERARDLYREMGAVIAAADATLRLGMLAHSTGRNSTAREHYAQAAAIYQEAEFREGESNTLLVESRSAYALEDFSSVRPILDRGLSLILKTTSKTIRANILQEIGRQQLLVGDYADATRLLDEALELHLEVGFRLGEANIYWERGRIAFAQGRGEEARYWFTKSLDVCLESTNLFGEAQARHEMGKLYLSTGEAELVEPMLDRALQINIDTNYLVGEAEVRNSIAAYRADVDGAEAGLRLYREAYEVAVRAEHPLERARGLEGMARCEVALGMVEAGVEHLREAVELYGRMKVVEYRAAAARLKELEGPAGG